MIFVLLTSVAAPTGTPFSLYESNATPDANLTPVAGPGAVCVRNDAGNVGLYINTATNVWFRIGGALGPLYPDDVPATWGTTSPAQGTITYVSASARWEMQTIDISAVAATQQTRPILVRTGLRTTTDANAGQVSGGLVLASGGTVQTGAAAGGNTGLVSLTSGIATQSAAGVGGTTGAATFGSGASDSTVAGGTGAATGGVTVASGAATSTLGTSGSTGLVNVTSGASDDANTGNVTLQSGNALAAGAVTTGSVTVQSGTVGGTGTTGGVSLVSGSPVGAGISGNGAITTGNVAGAGTTGTITLTTGNAAGAGTSGTIRFVVGTAPGGTVGTIDFRAATLTTTNQATQLQLLDASATAFSIGAAGALNMLVFNTSNAAEELIVNAVNGARAVDSVGFWVGTLANDRYQFEYNLANTRGEIVGTAITGGGAGQGTRAFLIASGQMTQNDAAGTVTSGGITMQSGNARVSFAGGGGTGGQSGALIIGSGNTDCLLGANTAGPTGNVTISSGNALATAGTSGVSGTVDLSTGSSASTNTGNITGTTGNAAAAGGGVTSGSFVLGTGTVGGTGTTGSFTLTSGVPVGAGTSGGFSFVSGAVPLGGTSGGVTLQSGTTATGVTGNVALTTGNASGAGTSGSIIFTIGTTVAGTRGSVQSIGRLTTTDGVPAGNARVVGGQNFENPAASGALSGAAAVFSTGSSNFPANSFKVGTVVRFEALIGITAVSGGPTVNIQVWLNGVAGTLIFETTALAAGAGVAANSYFVLTGRLACRTVGAPGSLVGVLTYQLGAVNAPPGTNSSDIAGSAAGTYTVAITNANANTLDIAAVTDGAGTTVVLQDYRVYAEA